MAAGSSRCKEWTRSLICRPKDNLTTEAGLRAQRDALGPAIERESIPTSMGNLLSGAYAQIWLEDRDRIQRRSHVAKPKFIHNDFDWWLKLRKANKHFGPK